MAQPGTLTEKGKDSTHQHTDVFHQEPEPEPEPLKWGKDDFSNRPGIPLKQIV